MIFNLFKKKTVPINWHQVLRTMIANVPEKYLYDGSAEITMSRDIFDRMQGNMDLPSKTPLGYYGLMYGLNLNIVERNVIEVGIKI